MCRSFGSSAPPGATSHTSTDAAHASSSPTPSAVNISEYTVSPSSASSSCSSLEIEVRGCRSGTLKRRTAPELTPTATRAPSGEKHAEDIPPSASEIPTAVATTMPSAARSKEKQKNSPNQVGRHDELPARRKAAQAIRTTVDGERAQQLARLQVPKPRRAVFPLSEQGPLVWGEANAEYGRRACAAPTRDTGSRNSSASRVAPESKKTDNHGSIQTRRRATRRVSVP